MKRVCSFFWWCVAVAFLTAADAQTVQMPMLSGPDIVPPRATITAPLANAIVTNDTLTITGTASDNLGVAEVQVFLGDTNAPHTTATGTALWSVTLNNVPPGTNVVTIVTTDSSGNKSLPVKRSFFRSVRAPLTLQVSGDGFVLGANSDEMLELTRFYTLAADPSPDFLFAGWTGSVISSSPTLRFRMEPNMSLTAQFVTNLFPTVKGTYNGLFYDTNRVEQQSSGFLTLTVGDEGAYTAKVLMNGRSYSFRGTFAVDGKEVNLVLRPGTNALLLDMALDLEGGTDRLTGVVTNNQVSLLDTDHGWSAELIANRSWFSSLTNSAPLAGKYTLIIPADTESPTGPAGDGFGNVTVDANGRVSLSGSLADGTRVVQKAPLSKTGLWPLYLPLYRDKGAVVSWVQFDTNQPTTDLSGLANWFKRSQPTARYYPGGFTNEATIAGSRYTPPTTNRVLNVTNAIAGFTNGNLASFANNLTLGTDNKVVNHSSNRISLTIQKPTGLFTGSVTPPGGRSARSIKGALLQKQNSGSGFFLGTNQSGRVSIAP